MYQDSKLKFRTQICDEKIARYHRYDTSIITVSHLQGKEFFRRSFAFEMWILGLGTFIHKIFCMRSEIV